MFINGAREKKLGKRGKLVKMPSIDFTPARENVELERDGLERESKEKKIRMKVKKRERTQHTLLTVVVVVAAASATPATAGQLFGF